ncbi:PREDICTED: PI-PLC X domain-containing protein 1-like [Eufriesea mexicana]|uniref:PI-PLC X domain-containing protein 1-like n=1 Tax=Eufriesea mexicana TaxID=516756 RepID=UPI00083BC40C|nr:PREDICTED: PI-PLC X domain-containing protein 1-like [Eufriesea mexicana]XP_017765587.1 PREDICTED: PI-PLC X domain-containing protein 1-like [Eufriesea mexicana]XP_017765589.1 PREDICTED: PI-PLC X domain-containing protein 1-like [Eufriesea mexicana]
MNFNRKAMARCITSILLVSLSVIIGGTSAVRNCNSFSRNWQSQIGILVSPLILKSKIREIEIYWNNIDLGSGDEISLYEERPSGSLHRIYTVTPDSPSGIRNTGVQFEFIPSTNFSFLQECLKYSLVWNTNKGTKKVKCFKTQPTWMKDLKSILGPLKMKEIFLPGTHDSASYDEDDNSFNLIANLAVTQDLDILGQLIHGVRYLDIRVGHYENTKEIWWTNHGLFYRSVPLKIVIDQVKLFLNNTEEIVIMDIREFPIGFNNISDHRALVSYLEEEFRDYYHLNNHGWGITLNEIWSSGRRLIIGYEQKEIVNSYDSMWPCVLHKWGNVKNVQKLYEYLHKIETEDSNEVLRPRAAMAELTADFSDILLNKLGNLRKMAHSVNLNVSNWYSTIWQFTANIVAVDFVRSTDIVDIAIQSNKNRHLHCRY